MKTNVLFFIVSCSVFLTVRNVWDKSCRENQSTHFTFINFFFFLLKSYRLWNSVVNNVEPDRPPMKIWRMRFACWLPKLTNTHSEYVTLIAFPLQQWLHETASILHYIYTYIACLVLYLVIALHIFLFNFVITEYMTTKCDLWKVIKTLLTASACFLWKLHQDISTLHTLSRSKLYSWVKMSEQYRFIHSSRSPLSSLFPGYEVNVFIRVVLWSCRARYWIYAPVSGSESVCLYCRLRWKQQTLMTM